jgi:hypothetical protein
MRLLEHSNQKFLVKSFSVFGVSVLAVLLICVTHKNTLIQVGEHHHLIHIRLHANYRQCSASSIWHGPCKNGREHKINSYEKAKPTTVQISEH